MLSINPEIEITNEGARVLAEANAKNDKSTPILTKNNQDVIGDDLTAFYDPLDMFSLVPINHMLIEAGWIDVVPHEKSDSNIFTFDLQSTGGGLIQLADTTISANISVRDEDGDKLHAQTICDYVSCPLKTWWRSVEVSANNVAMSVSNTQIYWNDYIIHL